MPFLQLIESVSPQRTANNEVKVLYSVKKKLDLIKPTSNDVYLLLTLPGHCIFCNFETF